MKTLPFVKPILAVALLSLVPLCRTSAQESEAPRAEPVPGLPGNTGTADPFRKNPLSTAISVAANREQAPEPAVEVAIPPQVSILVEYIQVSLAEANRLVRANAGTRDVSKMREELDAAIEEGTAELIETGYILTKSGQRSKTESVNEMIYPTEFDPGTIPQNVSIDSVDLNGEASRALKMPPNPTAFEMRPTGFTVEVDPVIGSDARAIDINIAPEIVEYLGVTKSTDEDSPFWELDIVTQPNFFSVKLSTSTAMADGETILLGMQTPNPETAKDKRFLVFLRADIVR